MTETISIPRLDDTGIQIQTSCIEHCPQLRHLPEDEAVRRQCMVDRAQLGGLAVHCSGAIAGQSIQGETSYICRLPERTKRVTEPEIRQLLRLRANNESQ